ncbi:hypothetical protein BDV96DRAFT_603901 [Lophiotrema nucula]|uniref:Uncharacterized protein n=1 Tax=Lophiotrema nucula TaxID=690887 RepID=A0A6A5YTH3_9PLEO|nr:hypothetical protein BDV96DRAFT_603901 [Lophiotrema nucula]
MAKVALEVLGLLSGNILDLVPLLLPDEPNHDPLTEGNSLVRFGIGLSPDPNFNDLMGGIVPSIKVYNEKKQMIGNASSSNTTTVGPGQYVTVTVTHQGSGQFQQPSYLQVEADTADIEHAICISYIGQTWSDGTKLGWLGDIGAYCSQNHKDISWYYSELYVGMVNGTMYKPRCTWFGWRLIDGVRKKSVYTMRIHTPDFGRQVDSGFSLPDNPSSLCQAPSTVWYNQSMFASAGNRLRPIIFLSMLDFFTMAVAATSSTIKRIPKYITSSYAKDISRGRLIASSHSEHGARELCESPSSYGPDFVSFTDKAFCDMETKTAWPLCDDERARGCFDWDTRSLVTNWYRKRELKYRNVVEWT